MIETISIMRQLSHFNPLPLLLGRPITVLRKLVAQSGRRSRTKALALGPGKSSCRSNAPALRWSASLISSGVLITNPGLALRVPPWADSVGLSGPKS